MIKKEPTKKQKVDAVLYLRCIATYADFICDNIDNANALDYYGFDDVVERIIGVKSELYDVLLKLFGNGTENG
jgi:hypothetical protein